MFKALIKISDQMDNFPERLQLQLHKYIWGDVPGR